MKILDSGGVLFEKHEGRDAQTLRKAIGVFADRESQLRARKETEIGESHARLRLAKAMIYAGLKPDVDSSDKMTLEERLIFSYQEDVIVTQEEIEELRGTVEVADARGYSHREEIKAQAEGILGKIAAMQEAQAEGA